MKKRCFLFLFTLSFLMIPAAGMAEENTDVSAQESKQEVKPEVEEKSIIKSTMKEVNGEVSGISSNFIAILYGQDEKTSYEIALTIDKDVTIERKKSLKDIEVGDIVSVQYKETTETYKEKTETGTEKDITKLLSRVVKVVTFIKAPPKDLQALEEK